MKSTSIYIRITDNGQPVLLTTMDIKVLLLRASLTITQLAAREDMDCSREALSKTINGSLQFPEVRKNLTAALEEIAAKVAKQKSERKIAS
jgi:predicted DNA-binding protein (UPF0251 family)